MWPFTKRKQASKVVKYHPNGVPVGLYPGDPVDCENIGVITAFVQKYGQSIGHIAPGERKEVDFWETGRYN
jgi:hypothetical protein